MNIPLHRPSYDERECSALVSAMRSGSIIGDGQCTKHATEKLKQILGIKHAFLTPSCTHALELAMMVLDLKEDDEVILPSFAFVSTANCVMRQGARVVFADIEPSTLTIDINEVKRRITPRTKAVIPVGYAGVSPAMDELIELARRYSLTLVEDAAQSIGARYKGRPQGTLGDIGCFSFHETKNISTGEGGAFVTDSDVFASRAEAIREKGTNRREFLLGLVDKYTWVDVGSSYLPPDTTGALLFTQLEKMESIIRTRQQIYDFYVESLTPLADEGSLTMPAIPPDSSSNYHIFYVLMRSEHERNNAIEFFRSRNIVATFHYLPLHLSPVGQTTLGYKPGDLPVTESVSARLLRLPIFTSLSNEEQLYIVQTMKEFAHR
jgi:dTDP-4-amino-4,6-dideoxygalactose transaminase